LKKTANLEPFNVDPATGDQQELYDARYADDVIFGGLGDDFLHGGSGDDAMSGAEALPVAWAQWADGVAPVRSDYTRPFNPGGLLGYGTHTRAGEFFLYDEYNPLAKILVAGGEFLLNFASDEGPQVGTAAAPASTRNSDGDDVLFGDLGNDWLVGGTGRDTLYGGWGNDLHNADDVLATTGTDTHGTYEDRAFGGAGLDILIANTGGDRLIDWTGEFNSYLVPFAPFGLGTVSRQLSPGVKEFLYALSRAQGADPTRAADTGADPLRNGEPEGELGLVVQSDPAWQDQTGGPSDPQPGNIPGGPRDVLRSADFNNGSMSAFAPDSGTFAVTGGALEVGAESLGKDAAAVYYHDQYLPTYYEISAPDQDRQADRRLEGQRLRLLRLLLADRLQVRRHQHRDETSTRWDGARPRAGSSTPRPRCRSSPTATTRCSSPSTGRR
jgi:hypothetical protein